MVLYGDNDTLVYTRDERRPRSSKGKRKAGFQEQKKDKKDQGNRVGQKTSPARGMNTESAHHIRTLLLEDNWEMCVLTKMA
jgi:hypothetical protein